MYRDNNIMRLLKIIGMYQITNPNSSKTNGINIYKLININLIVLTTTITLIGIFGICYEMEDTGSIDTQQLFYFVCNSVGNLKVTMIIYNSDRIRKLFDIKRDLLLSSKHSVENFYENHKRVVRFVRISYLYILLFITVALSWALIPILLNNDSQNNDLIRKTNILNLIYPITTETYNKLYWYFYTMELITLLYTTYGLLLYDIFIILILPIIFSHYDIILSAFQNLKSRDDEKNGESIFNCT